jgi:hypothetical protein
MVVNRWGRTAARGGAGPADRSSRCGEASGKAEPPPFKRWGCPSELPGSPMRVQGERGVVKVWWHGRVVRSSCGRSPSRVMGVFPADFTFKASGEVVGLLETFKEPLASSKAGGKQRVRHIDDSGRKTPCIQKLTRVGGEVEYWHVRRYESTMRPRGQRHVPCQWLTRGERGPFAFGGLSHVRVPMRCQDRGLLGIVGAQ